MTQAFDILSRRTSLAATIDSVEDFINAYQYDALSRMTRITQQGQSSGNAVAEKRIDLAYNAAGQFTSIDRYADVAGTISVAQTDYAYDLIGRLTDLTHADGGTTIADYDWTYDAFSRVTQFVSSADGTSDYTYDDTNQLTDADHTSQTDENYSYDENGNRTNTGYSTGDNNRLTSDGTFNYTYDNEGNRLTRTRISSDPADDYLIEYTWDYRNRLTKVTFKNNASTVTKVAEYTYDLFNRRIQKAVDATSPFNLIDAAIENYIYDDQHIALALDGTGALLQRFLHNPNVIDQVLADEQFDPTTPGEMPTSPGDVYWPLTDNQGSVRDVVDNTGAVVVHVTFGAFGQITQITNPTGIAYLFAYTGREYDAETGQYYYRARYYDASTGRFISEDPIGFFTSRSGGKVPTRDLLPNTASAISSTSTREQNYEFNLQRYAGNSTLNRTDPSGETWIGDWWDWMWGKKPAQTPKLPPYRPRYKPTPEGGPSRPLPEDFPRPRRLPPPTANPAPPPPLGPWEDPPPEDSGETLTTVVHVGAGVGAGVCGGYIIYRCVRMVPSLFPPLWPTISPLK